MRETQPSFTNPTLVQLAKRTRSVRLIGQVVLAGILLTVIVLAGLAYKTARIEHYDRQSVTVLMNLQQAHRTFMAEIDTYLLNERRRDLLIDTLERQRRLLAGVNESAHQMQLLAQIGHTPTLATYGLHIARLDRLLRADQVQFDSDGTLDQAVLALRDFAPQIDDLIADLFRLVDQRALFTEDRFAALLNIVIALIGLVLACAGVSIAVIALEIRMSIAAQDDATLTQHRLASILDAIPARIVAFNAQLQPLLINRYESTHGARGGLTEAEKRLCLSVVRAKQAPPINEETDHQDEAQRTWLTARVPVFKVSGEVDGLVSAAIDITERKAHEERARYLAAFDPLTGLANRATFLQQIEDVLAGARGREVALLCLDLDGFKQINDTLGLDAGDEMLCMVARRLQKLLRQEHVVARLCSDEFAILIHGVDDANAAADDLARRVARALAEGFAIEDRPATLQASMGIVLYPQHAGNASDMLRLADRALHRAKADGKNVCRLYDEEMAVADLARAQMIDQLRNAINHDQLSLAYQPQFNLVTGEIIGVEALVRWRHPDHGEIPPGTFVTLAEESGLIGALGTWVLHAAAQQIERWTGTVAAGLRVGVNISPAQFSDPGLIDEVKKAIRLGALTPACLELEITETSLMRDVERAAEVMTGLKKLGVILAVDDFGTGYSSLSYLKHFPFDTVKLDRAFVSDIAENRTDQAIVKAIVELSQRLHKATIAEGIETQAQMATLRALGCQEGQGYLFAKPLSAEGLLGWLEGRRSQASGTAISPPDPVSGKAATPKRVGNDPGRHRGALTIDAADDDVVIAAAN